MIRTRYGTGDGKIHTHYDQFGGHGFLEDLPELYLPPAPVRPPRPKADPRQEAVPQPPQWTKEEWPGIRERFRASREQVCIYFNVPKIKEYWVKQIEEVTASAGSSAQLFPKLPQWSDGKAKIYATMGICAQLFTCETLIPESIQKTEWYKSNRGVYEYVACWDIARTWMDYIEQDLREQSLLGGTDRMDTAHSPNGQASAPAANAESKPGKTEVKNKERVLRVQGDEAFYGDIPLDIPTGKATDVFKILLSNLGHVATWKALGCEGADPKEVDDQTKQAKMKIQRTLRKAKAPYEIKTLRRIGYRLQEKDARPRKSG